MKNLSNNKIYKIGQLTLLLMSVLSFVVMIIRYFVPYLASKLCFASTYISWTFWNIGLSAYQDTHSSSTLIKLIISCVILYGIPLFCLLFSRKSEWFMVGALGYIFLDTVIFAIDMINQYRPLMLTAGLIVKVIIILILSLSIYYAFLGYSIQYTEEPNSPALKFIDSNYSEKLVNKKRYVNFERTKSFINSYIYLQVVIDGKTVCYLKDNETKKIEIDANQHMLIIIPHYERINYIKRIIPSGEEESNYVVSIQKKSIFSKQIEIYKIKKQD